jgi:hypothetical protein
MDDERRTGDQEQTARGPPPPASKPEILADRAEVSPEQTRRDFTHDQSGTTRV